MKILVISNYRPYHTARPEAEIFIGLAQLGVKIDIMTYGDAEYFNKFQEAGINVIDFHPEKKMDKSEIAFIRNHILEGKHDIIKLYNNPAAVNGIQAAKGLPIKVVLYRGYAGNIHWYDPTAYTKFLHRRVDKILCNSQGVADVINNQPFVNKDKTYVVNKGHRLEWYQDVVPLDIKKEFNLPEDAFVIINVANNRRMKGIPYLMKAMNMLPPGLPIHLLLIGGNMDTKANIALIKSGDYKDKVHFVGFRDDVLNIVAASDVFASASIKGESITKSIIEAMSLEIAPIITDIPGNVELCDHEDSGLVVKMKNPKELSDAILRLYNDRDLCEKLAKNAKARIGSFLNTDRSIKEMKQFYDVLITE